MRLPSLPEVISNCLSELPEQRSCVRPGPALLNECVGGSRWMPSQQKIFSGQTVSIPIVGLLFHTAHLFHVKHPLLLKWLIALVHIFCSTLWWIFASLPLSW